MLNRIGINKVESLNMLVEPEKNRKCILIKAGISAGSTLQLQK